MDSDILGIIILSIMILICWIIFFKLIDKIKEENSSPHFLKINDVNKGVNS